MKSKHIKDRTPDLNPLQVKIELLKRGESLLAWSRRHGYEQSTVWTALHRHLRGRKTNGIAAHLKKELGL